MHRGLGDAVHVHQPRRGVPVPGEPALQAARLERLTTEDHVPQGQLATGPAGRAVRLGELVERRRRLIQHRHTLANEQLAERLRRARGEPVHDDEGAAVQQRTPQLPHREVERVRVEHRPHVRRAETVDRLGVDHQPHHVPVRDQHALRPARGPGGVDDVREVRGVERRGALLVADRRVVHPRQVDGVELDHRHRGGHVDPRAGEGEHRGRRGVGEHELDPVGRVVRVHRQIPAAGLEHRDERDHQIQ
ncbi:hypothetical protein EBESD8_48770 [Rhodococcus aetherivorans]|nr:hypothetical protein EBESD8_48770 [Rhodococcus aetherivorans]